MSCVWTGHQTQELLEETHGHPHGLEKPPVSLVSLSLCSQRQSQVPYEGEAILLIPQLHHFYFRPIVTVKNHHLRDRKSPPKQVLFFTFLALLCKQVVRQFGVWHGLAEKSRAFVVKTLHKYCKSSLTVLLFPGTSAPGPGRDLPVWTLPLYLLPSFQPEAPHALPPALPPFRSQGEGGADHWHGGRRLPDGWQWLGGPEGHRNVPAAVRHSAADVVSSWGLLQSHPHQGGAAGKRSLHALTLQHVQGPSWQHCKFLGSTRGGDRSPIQSQWSQWSQLPHRLPVQPWHQYQDRHWPAYETLRYVKLLFSTEFICIFACWFMLNLTC